MDQVSREARERIFARLNLLSVPDPADGAEEPTGSLAWMESAPTVCDFCRRSVPYSRTRIESEPLDHGDRPVFYGMATSIEFRVCSHH